MSKGQVGYRSLSAIICFVIILVTAFVAPSGRGVLRAQIPVNPDDEKVIPVIPTANRYQEGKLFLERADKLLKPSADVDYQVLLGNVMFRRDDMYMYCDSAHFYDATSSLEAFGNVKMEQGDTLFVYADELEYADSTQKAILYANPGKKVRLINRDVELKTDVFNYDMSIELGYYEVGGELTDNQNRLTSIYGEYAPNTKDAIFRNNVHLNSLSRGDTLNIYTDALYYNTDTHIAELDAPSTILSKDGTVYTDNGIYNTETDVADLYSRSLVVTSTGKTLTGDTLFYDHKLGYGKAWGNMILNDTVNKSRLLGDYGFYNELTDRAFVTGHALAVDYSQPDSLSLHGDTIQAFRVITITRVPIVQELPTDSLAGAFPIDSLAIAVPGDSLLAVYPPDSLAIAAPIDSLVNADSLTLIPDTLTLPLEINQVADTLELPTVVPDSLTPALNVEKITEITDTLAPVPDFRSLEIMADSISQLPDSLRVPLEVPDSIAEAIVPAEPEIPMMEIADTTHHIVAYPNVRFFRRDLQGVCDSLTFVQKDSLLYMDIDPIVWSDQRQIFGEQIVVHMNDSTADRVNLPKNAFMAEMLEEGYYNQLSGREMVAYLSERTLRHLDVSGNVTMVFFPMEEDSTYNKVANAESSFMAADFDRGQITRMKLWSQSNETITPLYLAKKSLFFLPGFRWEVDRRPTGHDDVFPRIPAPEGLPIEETSEEAETPETAEADAESTEANPDAENTESTEEGDNPEVPLNSQTSEPPENTEEPENPENIENPEPANQ